MAPNLMGFGGSGVTHRWGLVPDPPATLDRNTPQIIAKFGKMAGFKVHTLK